LPPTVYGIGSGFFNKYSIQIPGLMRLAIKTGQTPVVGEGKGIWSYVHVLDIAKLYELLVLRIINREDIPIGEDGLLFSTTGRFSWREVSENIAKSLVAAKAIKTETLKSLSLEEASKLFGFPEIVIELGFASK
jgi:nucleoside-diphosphate-sugar epimerase